MQILIISPIREDQKQFVWCPDSEIVSALVCRGQLNGGNLELVDFCGQQRHVFFLNFILFLSVRSRRFKPILRFSFELCGGVCRRRKRRRLKRVPNQTSVGNREPKTLNITAAMSVAIRRDRDMTSSAFVVPIG